MQMRCPCDGGFPIDRGPNVSAGALIGGCLVYFLLASIIILTGYGRPGADIVRLHLDFYQGSGTRVHGHPSRGDVEIRRGLQTKLKKIVGSAGCGRGSGGGASLFGCGQSGRACFEIGK